MMVKFNGCKDEKQWSRFCVGNCQTCKNTQLAHALGPIKLKLRSGHLSSNNLFG